MTAKSGASQRICLRGEVVEISERDGRRLMKITVEPHNLVDVVAETLEHTHLGDRVRVEAQVRIERVGPDLDTARQSWSGPPDQPKEET